MGVVLGAGGLWSVERLATSGGSSTAGSATSSTAGEDAHGHDHSADGGHDHQPGQGAPHDHPRAATGHAHEEHTAEEDASEVSLSPEALKTAGVTLGTVQAETFERTLRVPGIVAEWPGRSRVEVPAALTGVVAQIFVTEGQAVVPGDPLCELRLTQEDLVQTQATFLSKIENLDVVEREIARLEAVAEEGVIARKSLLGRQYEKQQLEAELRAQGQALLLHGLSTEQVEQIRSERKLFSHLTVRAPALAATDDGTPALFQVARLSINPGQSVTAGTCLVELADHRQLWVEGRAFEQDRAALEALVQNGWKISLALEADGKPPEMVAGLTLLHVANQVEADSRTLRFYLKLDNTLVHDATSAEGRRVIDWRFRPGQRMHVLLPVERWDNRIVLPLVAVAQEGVENYVFVEDGGHFHRQPVRVEYRDPQWVVIAAEGGVRPGDRVALAGAHQLLLTWKNKLAAGGEAHVHDHPH